jgi:large subunit ribosomal protein L19
MLDIIKAIESEQLKQNLPNLKIGDTVKVHVKVKEGNRERLQVFEGTIIGMKGHGVERDFHCKKDILRGRSGKNFPVHSPKIDHIDIVRRGKIRRAKLYYLRDRVGKAAKVKEKLDIKA